MSFDWYGLAIDLKKSAADGIRDGIQSNIDVYVKQERENGILIMTSALYEAKVEDDQIIYLLQKYYGLSNKEAEERLLNEKTVQSPCQKLHDFLMREEGFTDEEADNFIFTHQIPEMLKNNKGLWKQSTKDIFRLAQQN